MNGSAPFPMSPDETIVMLVSAAVAIWAWIAWYLRALRIRRLRGVASGRMPLLAAPVIAGGIVFVVLQTLAASDVRDDPRYLTLYFVLGLAWVGGFAWCLPLVGISVRDDVLERANRAAGYAAVGALLAVALCYAGGNVGDGPGWWVVVFSAGLATVALFVVWFALETFSSTSEAVTIDRDVASGVRLGGFLLACGAVFGRAAAGNWVSSGATVRDFLLVAQPVLLLLMIAVVLDRVARPTVARPAPSVAVFGLAPAAAYVAAAVAYVTRLGAIS